MENNEKILKQKNSLRSEINIKFSFFLVSLAEIAWLIWACGLTVRTATMIYFGYMLLGLVLRIFRLAAVILVSVGMAGILILIISLLIF
ncbi:MAG: hypothetical protein LBQ28_00435 [Prevotellaceae bacterium]|jgi:hypothetical protein|nr:hypothetical protein [Prevotellaceae bacterium]